jgi:hypothetical protein
LLNVQLKTSSDEPYVLIAVLAPFDYCEWLAKCWIESYVLFRRWHILEHDKMWYVSQT